MKYNKKYLRIIIIMLFISVIVFSFIPVNALTANQLDVASDNANEVKPILASVLQIVGIIASATSIVTLIILGIKYMMGSVEEKATYKKTLFPYFIGAIFVFGATTIANVIYKMF